MSDDARRETIAERLARRRYEAVCQAAATRNPPDWDRLDKEARRFQIEAMVVLLDGHVLQPVLPRQESPLSGRLAAEGASDAAVAACEDLEAELAVLREKADCLRGFENAVKAFEEKYGPTLYTASSKLRTLVREPLTSYASANVLAGETGD